MSRALVTAAVALLVGAGVAVSRFLVPVLGHGLALPSPAAVTLVTQAGQLAAFLLTYGLLFATAYWAGGGVVGGRDLLVLTVATAVAGFLGYLVAVAGGALFADVFRGQGLAATLVLVVGPPVGVGVRLGVVALAGAAGRRVLAD